MKSYQELEKQLQRLKDQMTVLQDKHVALKKQHTTLQEKHTKSLKQPMGVYKYFDCSTAHITQQVNDWMENVPYSEIMLRIKPHDYGFWVQVPQDDQELSDVLQSDKVPDCLKAILKKADALECVYVNIDRDGDIYPDLMSYDW